MPWFARCHFDMTPTGAAYPRGRAEELAAMPKDSHPHHGGSTQFLGLAEVTTLGRIVFAPAALAA
jgi:hypothetical protein